MSVDLDALDRAIAWLKKPPPVMKDMYRGAAKQSYAQEAATLAVALEKTQAELRALKARVEGAPVLSVQCDNDGPYVEVPERMIGQRVALVGLND